ncbi:U2-type spliceosomal complex subunit CWC21 ASCRUDRAFT_20223, partial [Ascoidea rubescens DSM 1968]
MSYNGIGLSTARGSATNGYIQRNISNRSQTDPHQKNYYERRKYLKEKNELEKKKALKTLNFKGDKEILLHEKKRLIQIKCMELQEQLEDEQENGDEALTDEIISQKVNDLKSKLFEMFNKNEDSILENHLNESYKNKNNRHK